MEISVAFGHLPMLSGIVASLHDFTQVEGMADFRY